jgi:hypothetical protein
VQRAKELVTSSRKLVQQSQQLNATAKILGGGAPAEVPDLLE